MAATEVITTTETSNVSANSNIWSSAQDSLRDSFSRAMNELIHWLPKIAAMTVVLVIGYIVARLVARAVTLLGERIGFQKAAERSGLAKSMTNAGIKRSVPAILGTLVFWLLLCVFMLAAFNVLGVQSITNFMTEVVDYIPKLLVATVVIVVGLLVASFLRGVVATSAEQVGISYGDHLANACYFAVALLTVHAALHHLGMEFKLFENLVLISFAGLAIGFGLAFGLGGRDVMAGILSGYYLRQRLQSGDKVQVAGFEGTVREVGPVATIIETNEHGLLNRHSVPNTRMLNEAVR